MNLEIMLLSGPTTLATYDCADPNAEFSCTLLSGDENLPVDCTSTSWDTVDSSLDHFWTFGDGATSIDVNPSHTYVTDGDYTVSLTVTDDVSRFDVETKTDYIDVFDVGPIAGFSSSANPVDEGIEVDFTDSSTSHDPILSRNWVFGDGGTSTDVNPSHTYGDNGVYTVNLTICDEDNDCNSATEDITVNDVKPIVNAGEYICDEGETITLTATESDVTADPATLVEWDFDGDEDFDDAFGLSVSYDCGNGDDTVTTDVTVKVTNKDDFQVDDAQITVDNVAPIANANGPYNATVGESVCFLGSATDVWDTSFTYEWDFDYDGSFDVDGTGETPCTTYGSTGVETIALRATDDFDTSAVVTTTVTVYDYSIHLHEGWNLISIPLVPEDDDTTVETVFGHIAEDVLIVWAYTYDPAEDKNVWTYHEVTAGVFDAGASLQNVVPGYGYYVKMAEEAELFLNGEIDYQVGGEDNDPVMGMPPSVTLVMNSWNLIGVYGLEELDKGFALRSLRDQDGNKYYDIMYDENGENPWRTLSPLEGYWLSIKKAFAGSDTIEYKANYKDGD